MPNPKLIFTGRELKKKNRPWLLSARQSPRVQLRKWQSIPHQEERVSGLDSPRCDTLGQFERSSRVILGSG